MESETPWAICRSIASDRHPSSLSNVQAVARNPYGVTSLLSNPNDCKAPLRAVPCRGRDWWRREAKTYSLSPEILRSFRRSSSACRERGTRCWIRAFMHSAGIRHCAACRSNCCQRALRSSPGGTKKRRASFKAMPMTSRPVYPSIARSNSPSRAGSVIPGRCRT